MRKTGNLQYKFVLAIPIINAIASNTTEYFNSTVYNPGNLRALLIGVFALYFIFTKIPNEKIFRFVLFYLFFYGLLVLISTDMLHSGNLYFKFFLGVIMFPIGYYYINSIGRLKELVVVLFVALVLHLINLAITNIFQLGTSDYLENTFYFGAGRVNITKNIIVLVFVFPLTMLFFWNHRFKIILVYLIGFMVAMVGIKRSVLLSGAVGVITYFFYRGKISYLLRFSLGFSILFLIILTSLPSVSNLFTSRFEARGDRVEITGQTLESEGRYDETRIVWDSWISGSFRHKLIGSEVFNDRIFFNSARMLHTDYMIMLNGSGVIGFLLWFYMYYLIIKEKQKFYRKLRNNSLFIEINAVFWVLLATQILLSISGTVYAIEVRSLLFLLWGAFIGTMRGHLRNLKKSPENEGLLPISHIR